MKRLHFAGSGLAALDTIEKEITMVISELKASGPEEDEDDSEILLVIDQPDFLLAATGPSKGIGATEMGEWIMGLQQVCSRRCNERYEPDPADGGLH
jgi:elongator complex protein 6